MSIVEYLALRAFRKFQKIAPTAPAMEPVYQRIFERDLRRAGIKDTFHPVGAAANYGLLYLILRIAEELKPIRVLDIGAGQSSMLLSDLTKLGWVQKVLTVESHPEWASTIAAKVDNELLISPLSSRRVANRHVDTYDWTEILARGPFDVIVCDGPRSTPRYSRLGVVSILDETLPKNFVIILDDAERVGEQDTKSVILDRLRRLERSFYEGSVKAAKKQAIIAGGAYWPAAFY